MIVQSTLFIPLLTFSVYFSAILLEECYVQDVFNL